MDKEWVSVYSSKKLHNVELLRHILKENDIRAVVLNQQDSFYVTIGEIRLMVRPDKVMHAKTIIAKADL
jgi:hypothetical protein